MAVSSLDQADLDLLLQSPKQWPNYSNYQPLDQSHREIRVLRIWHETQKDQIHASVAHKSLEEDFEYDALSYYWGPPDQQKSIYIEGQPVLIRRSLHSFLNALCHHKQDRPVWLDSICINQRDVKERNSQVAMMGDIYRSATCVKAWIGETDADLEYSFAYLRNRGNRQLLDSEHSSEVAKRAKGSLQQVLSRPYWHRLWIIQEIGLAKKAIVLAGKRSVDLEELMNFGVHELELAGTFLQSLSELRTRIDAQGSTDRTGLDNTLRSSTTKYTKLEESWLSSETVLGRMSAFGNHLCENPRDKIFGLLSLSTDENSIEVDYEKTLGEIVSQLLHSLVKRHAHIMGDAESSPHALPLARFQKMFEFASRAATMSSFEIDDLTDLKEPIGYELCCGIKSMEAQVYGRLTPAFSWNGELCKFRKWDKDKSPIHKRRSKMPRSRPKPWYDSMVLDNDTNFYEISYDRLSNGQVCYYLGEHEPDPIRCRFFKIHPTPSILSPTSPYAQSDVYVDQVMLLVEFDEKGARVAGVFASDDWWDLLFSPGDTMGIPYFITFPDVLAVLLLEGEVQICSRVILDENRSWYDGKMKLRLHCSRLSSMIMLVAGPGRLDEKTIRNALKEWRAIHPYLQLCDCEYDAGENLRYYNFVRRTNIEEIRELLKRDTKETQRELTSGIGIFDMMYNSERWADLPQDFDPGQYSDLLWFDCENDEDIAEPHEDKSESKCNTESTISPEKNVSAGSSKIFDE